MKYLILIINILIIIYCKNYTVNLVNQINDNNTLFTLNNKVYSQLILDYGRTPALIQACDDVMIPNDNYFKLLNISNGIHDCYSMIITFNTLRMKYNKDPINITIQLITHNEATNSPENIFFSKTLLSPYNKWEDQYLNKPSLTTIIINNGDLDDNNIKFNLSNPLLIKQDKLIWVSFYVSLPMNVYVFPNNTLVHNDMFWLTYNNDKQDHYHFFFKDSLNILRKNFISWTNANIVQPALGINTTSHNLAWSLSLKCYQEEDKTEVPSIKPITLQPSNNPTEEPTEQNTLIEPTNEPIEELTNGPTEEMTNEPTEEITNEPTIITSIPTIFMNNTPEPTYNITIDEKFISNHIMEILLIVFLLPFCCMVCLCFCCFIKRRIRQHKMEIFQKISIDSALNKNKNENISEIDKKIQMFNMINKNDDDDDDIDVELSEGIVSNNNDTVTRRWTSKKMYTKIDIDKDDPIPLTMDIETRKWLNKNIESKNIVSTDDDDKNI